jgi:predicted small lipoprotein YifL
MKHKLRGAPALLTLLSLAACGDAGVPFFGPDSPDHNQVPQRVIEVTPAEVAEAFPEAERKSVIPATFAESRPVRKTHTFVDSEGRSHTYEATLAGPRILGTRHLIDGTLTATTEVVWRREGRTITRPGEWRLERVRGKIFESAGSLGATAAGPISAGALATAEACVPDLLGYAVDCSLEWASMFLATAGLFGCAGGWSCWISLYGYYLASYSLSSCLGHFDK